MPYCRSALEKILVSSVQHMFCEPDELALGINWWASFCYWRILSTSSNLRAIEWWGTINSTNIYLWVYWFSFNRSRAGSDF